VGISPNSKASRRGCSPTMLAQWRSWRDVRRKFRALIGHHQLEDKALIGCFALSGSLFMGRFHELICRGSTHELSPTTATTEPCQCVWVLSTCARPTRRSDLSTWYKVVCVPPPVSHHCAGANVRAAVAGDERWPPLEHSHQCRANGLKRCNVTATCGPASGQLPTGQRVANGQCNG